MHRGKQDAHKDRAKEYSPAWPTSEKIQLFFLFAHVNRVFMFCKRLYKVFLKKTEL